MLLKICGTTSEDDALLAIAMGANALGFIFAPSPRQISAQRVADIVKRLPREDLLTVGVFRDDAPRRVVEVVYAAGLQAAQLHGRETPEEAQWIRQRVPMVIKAFPGGDPRVAHADDYGADAILLDSPRPGHRQRFRLGAGRRPARRPASRDRRRAPPRQRGRRHPAGQALGRRRDLGGRSLSRGQRSR